MEENNRIPEAPIFEPNGQAPVEPPVFEPNGQAPVEPPVIEPAMPTLEAPVVDNPVAGGPMIGNPATLATPSPEGLGATDPITMPEKPAEPDPEEEELKAPLKAAEPVPGSIGSAVSGPQDGAPVAATNPNGQNLFAAATANAAKKPAKKKTSQTTYILLGVVAAVIVIALVAVLIIQLNS